MHIVYLTQIKQASNFLVPDQKWNWLWARDQTSVYSNNCSIIRVDLFFGPKYSPSNINRGTPKLLAYSACLQVGIYGEMMFSEPAC